MPDITDILASQPALSVLFHGSVLGFVAFGAFVSWACAAPERRERRRLARLARVTGR